MDEKRYRSSWNKENGATSVEYVLLAALITGVIAFTVSVLGGQVLTLFTAGAAMFP
jgi:Flp pilus assembly pilin Flp